MTRLTGRLLSWAAPAATFAAVWGMTTTHVFTQTKTSSAPPLVITAYNGKTPATPYKSPKTPWGEPDLVGVWSSDDTAGIGMSRQQNCGATAAAPGNGRGRGGWCFGDRLFLNDEEYTQRQ